MQERSRFTVNTLNVTMPTKRNRVEFNAASESTSSKFSAGSTGNDFFHRVYNVVATIPAGKVSTYGHIGAALGAKSSARMVGWALNSAVNRPDVPAHRVVNRRGALSGAGHFATPTLMRELLEAEDVQFNGDEVDLEQHLWIPPIDEY